MSELDFAIISTRTIALISACFLLIFSKKLKSPKHIKWAKNTSITTFSICLFLMAMQVVTFHKNPWNYLFNTAGFGDLAIAVVAGLVTASCFLALIYRPKHS